MIPENTTFQAAQFDDQGKVAEFLTSTFADEMEEINQRSINNGMPPLDVKDELLAADDFYFSSVELMDCCILAKQDEQIIGVCCVNPFTSSLQYIAVVDSQQRRGIGSRLLSLGKKVLSKRGCTHVKLELPASSSSDAVISFFEKNNMAVITTSTIVAGAIF